MDDRNEYNDLDESTEKSNEAIEANAAMSQFFGSAKEVVARYTHCPICDSNLHFSHVTDFSRNLTQESARCPECGMKARRMIHRLQ